MYPDSNLNLNYETEEAIFIFNTAYGPLDNWSAHRVKLWGHTFTTLEHGYHWRKFSETAPDIAAEIMEAPSPWAAMRVDRAHKQQRRTDWDEVKVGIMHELLEAKLAQNDDVRAKLEQTGSKTIVENSPWDSFWGCGPDKTGQNTVGKLWMELREHSENPNPQTR